MRSFLSLAGSLALHGLAVLGLFWLASRAPVPAALIVELEDAIRVGDASALPGASAPSLPPQVARRRPPAPRTAPPSLAERLSEPAPAVRSEPSPGPPAALAETPILPRTVSQPSGSQPGSGESVSEADGGGIPGGGPLAMLAPSRGRGEGSAEGVGGGERGVPAGFGPYLVRLRQRIQEALSYPAMARRRGLTGTVQLEIDLLPSGKVASVFVRSSSAHDVLDEAALETVRRITPDPFPPGLPSRPLRVRLPIVFELR